MEFKMKSAEELLGNRGLNPGDKVQSFVDDRVLLLSEPYVPKITGMLYRSGQLATVIGSGEVKYNAPYARYQYYGKVMVGSAPKVATDKDLHYTEAPQRGALWFERMKIDHKSEILSGAKKLSGGK